MKRIMTRSIIVLIVAIAFFGGICFLAFRVVTQNTDWIQQPYNGHMAATDGLAGAGTITDRNGVVLAYNDANDKRCYHDDQTTRESLLHVVGDNSLNISTAVQSMFRTDLTGYSFFLGLGLPHSLKTNRDVQLTVDADACAAAYQALGGHKGACVVYNYKTGEVLCSTSRNSYDPANPPEITEENEHDEQYEGVYLDNVVSSAFTPGSTFKIITSASAIENIPDIYQQTFTCTGEYEVLGSKITCEYAHGTMTFEEAFAHSCNCAYAQIAIQLGDEKLKATAEELGFNHKGFTMSGIPLATSHYDATGAGDNYLAWSGIGQYQDLANPLHMAMVCSAVANGGTATSPYIIQDDGTLLNKLGIDVNKASDVSMIDADTAVKVQDLMRGAANYYYNGSGVSMAGLNFCAKTGTAEVGEGKQPTAWFVGYCEDEQHPYAFAAVVVEGGYGIGAAYQVANAAVTALVY